MNLSFREEHGNQAYYHRAQQRATKAPFSPEIQENHTTRSRVESTESAQRLKRNRSIRHRSLPEVQPNICATVEVIPKATTSRASTFSIGREKTYTASRTDFCKIEVHAALPSSTYYCNSPAMHSNGARLFLHSSTASNTPRLTPRTPFQPQKNIPENSSPTRTGYTCPYTQGNIDEPPSPRSKPPSQFSQARGGHGRSHSAPRCRCKHTSQTQNDSGETRRL